MATLNTERMTQEMHTVIAFAHDFAETHSLHYITPEILMLGLLEQQDEYTTSTLKALQFPVKEIKTKIVESLPPRAASRTENIALTPRSEQTIKLAYEEARRWRHTYIGVEHLLWSLMDSRAGLPSRLAAKADLTQEKAEPILRELFPASEAKQREEQSRRESTTGLMADWQKLRQTAQGTPHIPKWFLLTVRGIFSALFLLFVMIIITDNKMPLWERFYLLCIIGAITLGVWCIGVPRKMRRIAKRFRQWDNPAISGTLCEMLTWSDEEIRLEAMRGLAGLIPRMSQGERKNLMASHGQSLCRMLTPNTVKRDAQTVVAMLDLFATAGTDNESPTVERLSALKGDALSVVHVCEAAQACLDTMRLRKQEQSHQQTLLRASSSLPTENLLRASISPTETKPDELLRPAEESTPTA